MAKFLYPLYLMLFIGYFAGCERNQNFDLLAGGEDGNNGDAIYCQGDGKMKAGYYALDYLVQIAEGKNDSQIEKAWAHPAYLHKRLSNVSRLLKNQNLDLGVYDLAVSYRQFGGNYFTSQDVGDDAYQKWTFNPNLKTQNYKEIPPDRHVPEGLLTKKLFQSCFKGDDLDFRRAIFRKPISGDKVEYEYASYVRKELEPVQFTFLFVHEWLWERFHTSQPEKLSENTRKLRELNWYLHSKEFYHDDASVVQKRLFELGLLIKNEDGSSSILSREAKETLGGIYMDESGNYIMFRRNQSFTEPITSASFKILENPDLNMDSLYKITDNKVIFSKGSTKEKFIFEMSQNKDALFNSEISTGAFKKIDFKPPDCVSLDKPATFQSSLYRIELLPENRCVYSNTVRDKNNQLEKYTNRKCGYSLCNSRALFLYRDLSEEGTLLSETTKIEPSLFDLSEAYGFYIIAEGINYHFFHFDVDALTNNLEGILTRQVDYD